MFYSHQLLARKGPLGTVWCAAHAQHRLKKPQYTATDIPSTVDLIMYPETPMALRMSGHLLLGVVRIYSKKVDYLHHDLSLFNTWITKAFLPVQVDLPENARQAPVESVTLPQALNLDEFDLEDDTLEREFNNHRLSEEDITLTDQIPTGIDPYVAVTFDEDIFPESSPMDIDQFTVPVSEHTERIDVDMVHEAGPNNEPRDFNVTLDVGTDSPRNLTEEQHPSSPGIDPVCEKNRAHNLSPAPHSTFATAQQSVGVERTESLDDTLNEKEFTIPHIDALMSSRSGSTVFAGSEEALSHLFNRSAQLSPLPPSPPLPPTRPRKRMRFDKVTVLTNRIMKERLEDPSDTLCKRKKMPSSKIGVWRLNNQSKKDKCFNEPLFTGFSDALLSVFEKDCVASKPYLAVSDETLPQPAYAESVATEEQTPQTLEHLRDGGHLEFMPTPPPRFSPSRIDDFTTQPGTQETGSYRTEPSPSTIPEDRPGLRDDKGIEHLSIGGQPESMPSPPPRSPPSRIDDFTTQPGTEPSPSTIPEDRSGLRDDKGIEHLRRDGGQPESMPSPPSRSPRSRIDDFTTQLGTEPSPSTIPEERSGLRDDKGIEHLRRDGGQPESMPSSPPRSPPSRIDDFTTQPGTEPSPSTIPEDRPGLRDSGLPPVPDMTAEDLSFLESGGNTPVRSPASQDSDALSKRTRALVQYLKQRCSSSPTSSHPSEDLSLNEILTGKTRKLAARMFFETLVLKSRGLIDMQQDQPYGDIALKLRPALFSKVQT